MSRFRPIWRGITVAALLLLTGGLALFAWRFDVFPGESMIVPEYDVWRTIEKHAATYKMDPRFVYAICVGMSQLDAHSDSKWGRGIMHLSPVAWEEVNGGWYHLAFTYDYNIRKGIQYLDYCRNILVENEALSYPNLAMCFYHGQSVMAEVDFDATRAAPTGNPVFDAFRRGVSFPVPPPVSP